MIRGIVFDLFDTLVDQNHDRLAPVASEGRRVGATTPALHARATAEFGVSLSMAEFADRLDDVDRALRTETVDLGIELSTLDRFAALGARLELPEALVFGEALTQVHMGVLREAVTVPSHHEAVLTALAIDYRIGICSNFTHAETARLVLREAAFEPHLSSIVISDEVYNELIWDGRMHRSVAALPGMRERTIVCMSFSKTFAMTGWRLGYMTAPAEVFANAAKIQGQMTSNASSISQKTLLFPPSA